MAQGKKSFIAYSDWKNTFDALPNEQAGELIKHIFAYVNDENPTTDSILINAVFANIKTTLKRDLDRWNDQLTQRSEAGKISAAKRALTKSNERSTSVDETQRKSTDNVNVNVSVSDNVTVKEKRKRANKVSPPTLLEVISYFKENEYKEDAAVRAFNYYDCASWIDSKGNAVKNWKQKMQSVWFKEENKKPIDYSQQKDMCFINGEWKKKTPPQNYH